SKDPGAGKINYEDEEVLKDFAGHQIPEIYDPVRMNSFVNPELKMRKSFKIMLYAVFLVDLKSEKHRCRVYDTTTKKINEYYSNYLAENVAMQSTFFREVLDEEQIYANPLSEDFDYKQILIEAQQEIE